MSTSVSWPDGSTGASTTSYSIPAAGELNWSSLSTFLIALGQGAQSTTFQKFAYRTATTTPVTVAVTDCVIASKLGSPGAVTVNLPAGATKQVFFVFDATGDAATNHITINPHAGDTINGTSSLVISSNNGYAMLIYDLANTDWKVVTQAISNLTTGAIGAATTNGITITGNVINLGAADATHGGVLTTGSQSIAGQKTFNDNLTIGTNLVYTITADSSTTGSNANLTHATTFIRLTNASLTSIATLDTTSVGSGHTVAVINATGAAITLVNNYGSPPGSSAVIFTGTGANITLPDKAGCMFIYSSTASAWYIYAYNHGVLPVAQGGTGVTTSTGSGNVVLSSGPTLTAPVLGTPVSGNLSNCSNYPAATPSAAGVVTTFVPVVKSGVLTTTNAVYTILDTDGYDTFLFSTGNTNRTLTLPGVTNNANRIFKIIKTDSGTGQVQIVGTINGQSSSTLQNAINYQYGNCTIMCDGTNFYYVKPIIEQGTYTPTGSNGANTTVWTMNGNTQFFRTGNTVNISGVATITLGFAANVAWNISLPSGLAPTFGSAQQAGGSSINFGGGAAGNTSLQAISVNGNSIVQFTTNAGTSLASGVVNSFQFQYRLA